jgi:hypothetical protein
MFVRMNTVTGAENIDAGVTFLQDKVIPEVRGQKGFRGLTASGNRSTGDFGILGLWDTLKVWRPATVLSRSCARRR